MTEKELKTAVINNADHVVKALRNGNDVEIRRTSNGISVTEVKKKVLTR